MKRIKNKIAALVCGIALLCAVNSPALAQRCTFIQWTCCGTSHWGDYDMDSAYWDYYFLMDVIDSCSC